ncbi:MAG: DUF3499 domain-containing protein [Kocuria sp.]|nr:DUF3499 domain-containing protein [Kocuria sp.]
MTEKIRMCSRMMCRREASCTLTYAYSQSTVVIGPLATRVEPHAYDMCTFHASKLTAPRGWDIVRVDGEGSPVMSEGEGITETSPVGMDNAAPVPDNVTNLQFLRGLGPRS